MFTKLKDRITRRSRRKPDARFNTNNGSSNLNQSLTPTRPTTPVTTVAPPSRSDDPWVRAFDILQNREPELLADYKKHLASLQRPITTQVDLSTTRSIKPIVMQQLEVRENRRWKVALYGKEIQIREPVEKLVKFLLWTDPLVKNAISSQPHAALAWSGVSLLLPLLSSGTTQNASMLKGFNAISDIQLYWAKCEEVYLQSPNAGSYQDLLEPLAKLYSQIIEYQARVICHLSKAQLSRAWENVAGANDWEGITKQVEKSSETCSRFVDPLRQAEVERHWREQLKEMQESRDILNEIRQALNDNNLETRKIYQDQREGKFLQTLASNYRDDKDFNPCKVEGTCEWFFVDNQFRQWRDNDTSGLLWVTAGPGCGKSVLSRALIDERRLSNNVTTSTVCYFFFKDGFGHRMHSTDAICALLHQLFVQDSSGKLIKQALPSYKANGKSLNQNWSELWQVFINCATSAEAGEVVCVLDALDECESDSRRRLIRCLEEFYLRSPCGKLKFLITSRPYDELERSFRKISSASTYLRFDGDEKSEQIGHDIDRVIDNQIQDITHGFTDKDRYTITERLKSMENRTYLWLYLTFDAIEQSGSRRRADVESVLNVLAGSVAEKYEKMLDRSTNKTHTETLLQIVLAAKRAMTVDEANIALTIALQEDNFVSYAALESELSPKANFQSRIKNLCGLFITIHDSKLSFIHQTAREFLLDSRQQGHWQGHFTVADSHGTISRSCLDYLVLPHVKTPAGNKTAGDQPQTFFSYASRYWPSHYVAQQVQSTSTESKKEILAHALHLCDPQSENYQYWFTVHVSDRFIYPVCTNRLGVASYIELEEVVTEILKTSDVNINQRDTRLKRTPLSCAAERGHEGIVKLLLNVSGVDINSRDVNGWTSLSLAADRGHEGVVQLLLGSGNVEVNSRVDMSMQTPLSLAAQSGRERVVKLLLNADEVDVDSKDLRERTPLSWAAQGGHENIVKLLLETNKVNAESRNIDDWTPLSFAAEWGYDAVVKLILDTNKVNVNLRDKQGRAPLLLAVARGREAVVKLLLNTDEVNVDLKDNNGRTSLSWAAERGFEAVFKLLIETEKVDADSRDLHGQTPLAWAAQAGHETIVKLLLSMDKVNADSKDLCGWTPLMLAAQRGRQETVKLLLDTGKVNVNSKGNDGQTAVLLATERCHKTIAKLLQSYIDNQQATV